jgi:curved DNA-binding protein
MQPFPLHNISMDYYTTLGVQRSASEDDIKKAYRKLAMKHHPDRGGDEAAFKKISEAYDVLTDPKKKEIFDLGGNPNQQGGAGPWGNSFNQGPFEFHFNTGGGPGMDDIFNRFGFGGQFGQRPMRKNRSLNINIDVTLEEVLSGKELNAEITIPGTNKKKMINIVVPAGIESGQQIRYEGMGDDHIKDIKPGDLIVNINVVPHQKFRREHTNIIVEETIDVWSAMLGNQIEIKTLDGKNLTINIPPGTQPNTVLSCRGEGLPVIRSRTRGNLLIHIKVEIPRNLPHTAMEKLKSLKDEI